MPRYCIYCRTVYEEEVYKCKDPECGGSDFRYVTPEQFEEYKGKKVRKM